MSYLTDLIKRRLQRANGHPEEKKRLKAGGISTTSSRPLNFSNAVSSDPLNPMSLTSPFNPLSPFNAMCEPASGSETSLDSLSACCSSESYDSGSYDGGSCDTSSYGCD